MIEWDKLEKIYLKNQWVFDTIREYFDDPKLLQFNIPYVMNLFKLMDDAENYILKIKDPDYPILLKNYTEQSIINEMFFTDPPGDWVYKKIEDWTQRISSYYILLKEEAFNSRIQKLNYLNQNEVIISLKAEIIEIDYKEATNKRKGLEINKLDKELREFLNTELKYREQQTQPLTPGKPIFTPETDLLKEWILPDYLTKFTAIELELFSRGFIDNSYKWQKYKTDLADFLCVITSYKYFKHVVKGQKRQGFHYRQFISERYGFGMTGMTETWKKSKPKIDIAMIPFKWIEKPK